MVSGSVSNSGLFEKNLGKISAVTIGKFGSIDVVVDFLNLVFKHGNIINAASNMDSNLLPLHIQRIINDDRYLGKCVSMAKKLAVEKAEGVLYDRAINGYEEITYARDGSIAQRRKKYCSKSLMEYLKANCAKYQAGNKAKDDKTTNSRGSDVAISIDSFEVESYG